MRREWRRQGEGEEEGEPGNVEVYHSPLLGMPRTYHTTSTTSTTSSWFMPRRFVVPKERGMHGTLHASHAGHAAYDPPCMRGGSYVPSFVSLLVVHTQ